MLHALSLGSPPSWDDVHPELLLDLAGLEKMDDDALWAVARSRKESRDLVRYIDRPGASRSA